MRVTGPMRRFRAADWVVALIVAAIFVVPSLMLALGDKPNRFGFQMYSGYGDVQATYRDVDGNSHAVTVADFVVSPRIEIDWEATLPEALCNRIPDAVSVEVRQQRSRGTARRSVSC